MYTPFRGKARSKFVGSTSSPRRDVDVIELRRRVGMVFQKSNPFPKSIYENITYGLPLAGISSKARLG